MLSPCARRTPIRRGSRGSLVHFFGSGTVLMAGEHYLRGRGTVHCIDPFDGSGMPSHVRTTTQSGGGDSKNKQGVAAGHAADPAIPQKWGCGNSKSPADGERRDANAPDLVESWRPNQFLYETEGSIMPLTLRERVMDSNNAADFEKGRPGCVGRPDAVIGLIAIEKKHVDRTLPAGGYRVGITFVGLHPSIEVAAAHVRVEGLEK